ncbi:MAG: DUF1553 domain-containing protein [Planctomycetota bacterium]|nr:DUF1553 domain-containing protein [Planctomycetota bacterium]
MMTRLINLLITAAFLGAWSQVCPAQSAKFDQIASILGKHCLHCHNDVDQEGDFSLETSISLVESGYVHPGDAENSELLHAITVADGASPSMPKNGEPLASEEVNLIAAWIDAGAKWPEGFRISDAVENFDWWSFQPIRKPEPPSIQSDWARTPIDLFITAKHQELGLTHSPMADRRTLIRRLTYDLTGLPPTPAETEAFIHDPSDQAYETLVDRLLDSRHYGERWARHWLDVVKYADTCGYDKDKLRPNAWPYRDYVIRSFNDDKPYARFVKEQIAGDALFPGEADGILGLGFLASGPWDFIGHVEVPETKLDGKVARNLDRDEMVTNTLNTFCSVTVQCARCHNHKFDPFTQEHYYSLQALFAAVDRADRPYDLDPQVEQQRSELQANLKKSHQQLKKLDQQISEAGGPNLVDLDKEIETLSAKAGVQKSAAFGYHSSIASSPDTTKWVELDLGRPVLIDQIILHAAHDEFGNIGAGFGFPSQYHIELGSNSNDQEDWKTLYKSPGDEPNPGLTPVVLNTEGQTIRTIRVTATKLAERRNDYIMALAEVEIIDSKGNNVAVNATVRALDSIEAPVRWGKTNLVDSDWARSADPKSEQRLSKVQRERDEIWMRINTPERQQERKTLDEQIAKLKQEIGKLPQGRMVYAAATEFKPQGNFKPTGGKPRPIFVLHRGEIQQPRGAADPGLLPLSANEAWQISSNSETERRSKLAEWLTRRDHPLVWRSIVNRIWQYHFGEGIVSTPNDFGRMGALPTHPELLDWLATEFRDGGQSFKKLHRLIVTSSVYRQESGNHDQNAAVDNDNRYLWRMNRRRLTAEEIRDSILAASGRLNLDMGGPGFYLFKLEKTAHSPHYEYHKFDPGDAKSHRRSIYRFIVRSQPDPYMTTLDCADSSQSTPKRLETLTSLQALSLLNNRFNLEMSKQFSRRIKGHSDDQRDQITYAFQLVTARTPNAFELDHLNDYANAHGLENLCRVLFNLSEFVFID